MDSAEFIPWLRQYIEEHQIEVIIPSEGFLHAISENYSEFSHLLPDSVDIDVCKRCPSKVWIQQTITESLQGRSWRLPIAGIVRDRGSVSD